MGWAGVYVRTCVVDVVDVTSGCSSSVCMETNLNEPAVLDSHTRKLEGKGRKREDFCVCMYVSIAAAAHEY